MLSKRVYCINKKIFVYLSTISSYVYAAITTKPLLEHLGYNGIL